MSASEIDDTRFTRLAIDLADRHMQAGHGGPFGALIVCEGRVIAEGWNQVTSSNDPTAHAEVVAIRHAAAQLGRFELSGCVLYASCEPCPMCLAASYWARIDRMVFAAGRADAAAIGFDDAKLYREVLLPIEERSLPMRQMLRGEALAVFRAWEAKPDKVMY